MQSYIEGLPKVELHLHIEGTLEPDLMFELAARNGSAIPYSSVEDIRRAYQFSDLQSFLDIYYNGAKVLQKERDFYDLTMAYLKKAASQNVRHAEIFFDPQTHTERGIAFSTVIEGIHQAQADASASLGISSLLIMCFLRHLSPQAAEATLKEARPYKDWIVGVGLDSSEKERPPVLFEEVFAHARVEGYESVAHAGEEGPPEYVWQALRLLKSRRIDHGVRSTDDAQLMQYLIANQIPLTVCPLSNVKLCVFSSMREHNLKAMLDQGVCVTINSDDPAYFGGYMNENFLAAQRELGLSKKDLNRICENAIQASFLEEKKKQELQDALNQYSKSRPA